MYIQNINTNKVNKQQLSTTIKTGDYDNSSPGWTLNVEQVENKIPTKMHLVMAFAQSSHSCLLNAYNLIRHLKLNTLSCHDLI